MTLLYNRKAVIQVDTALKDISLEKGKKPALLINCGKDGFDCRFDVHKDLTGKPNRATIDVFNLNQEHRDGLTERATKASRKAHGNVRVRLEAGYVDGYSRIFEGDLSILYHEREGANWVTRIETGDGDHIVSTARISKSWAPGTLISTVIKDVAVALGLGEGNVSSTAGALLEGWGASAFTGGTVASGRCFKELNKICKSAGIEWSIQDGTLQFLATDKAFSAVAVLVTANTGMEGSIRIDHKNKLHIKTRMIPGIAPGRKIKLADDSEWRVNKAHYNGDTRGPAWGITVEAIAV